MIPEGSGIQVVFVASAKPGGEVRRLLEAKAMGNLLDGFTRAEQQLASAFVAPPVHALFRRLTKGQNKTAIELAHAQTDLMG